MGKGLAHAVEAQLGGRIVGLAEVAVDAGGRSGEDDAAEGLFAEEGPGGLGHAEGATQVHFHDLVPVFLAHLGEGDVAQDAGVVDQHVHAAKGILGDLHGLLGAFDGRDRLVAGDGLAAHGDDFVDDLVGRGFAGAFAAEAAAQVVDDHVGAARGEQQAVGTAQRAAAAGDHHRLAVITYFGHGNAPLELGLR